MAPTITDPCPELDVELLRRASLHPALIHAMRVERDQLTWTIRHHRMTGGLKGQHTRKINRLDSQLRDLAGRLIGGAA